MCTEEKRLSLMFGCIFFKKLIFRQYQSLLIHYLQRPLVLSGNGFLLFFFPLPPTLPYTHRRHTELRCFFPQQNWGNCINQVKLNLIRAWAYRQLRMKQYFVKNYDPSYFEKIFFFGLTDTPEKERILNKQDKCILFTCNLRFKQLATII